MIDLKKVIHQLDGNSYTSMEELLVKNKANNFLFLMRSYRVGDKKDNEIIKQLDLNSNSFYVLKSRLYEKIQNHLTSGQTVASKDDLLKQILQIPNMCFFKPRETTNAFLQKLEKDLVRYDMHNELLLVYSALKKINLNSDKYFYYSQLFNRHIAFSLSLEKAEDILGNFNRILAQYDFSKARPLFEKLYFLKKEIFDHFALNPSRQIEIIKNLIELQLYIFCYSDHYKEYDAEEVLLQTGKKIEELPDSSGQKKWKVVLDFLGFEYYKKTGNNKVAKYFEKVNENGSHLLLFTGVCLTSKFLISKIRFLQERNLLPDLLKDYSNAFLLDPHDTHSKVLYGMYKAMLSYYSGKTKEAINILNDIINLFGFKDYFHINLEIKLTQAYFYISINEMDLAENILKSIYRKIKAEELNMYANALDLIKLFNLQINSNDAKKSELKQNDLFTLFTARNIGEFEILQHLQMELKEKYGK